MLFSRFDYERSMINVNVSLYESALSSGRDCEVDINTYFLISVIFTIRYLEDDLSRIASKREVKRTILHWSSRLNISKPFPMRIKHQLTPKVKTRETAFDLSIKLCSNQGWARNTVPVPYLVQLISCEKLLKKRNTYNGTFLKFLNIGRSERNVWKCASSFDSLFFFLSLPFRLWDQTITLRSFSCRPWKDTFSYNPSPCETMWDLVSQSFSLWDKYEERSMSHNPSLSEEAILNEERTTEDERR